MSQFVVTPLARADLLEIWEYIAQDSLDAADKVLEQIHRSFDKLAEMPGMGHFRQDLLNKRYKIWRVYSYLVAYRWDVKPIQIVAVVHGARDLEAFFGDRKT